MKPATPGISYKGQVHPKPSDLASALGNTGVDVVSSPATIGYLEMACHHASDQFFDDGEASVGVGFDMQHVGAATPDLPVEVAAELIAVDGRRLTFAVEATQAGKQIMTGTHQRAVVNLARLIAGTVCFRCSGHSAAADRPDIENFRRGSCCCRWTPGRDRQAVSRPYGRRASCRGPVLQGQYSGLRVEYRLGRAGNRHAVGR